MLLPALVMMMMMEIPVAWLSRITVPRISVAYNHGDDDEVGLLSLRPIDGHDVRRRGITPACVLHSRDLSSVWRENEDAGKRASKRCISTLNRLE